MLIKVLNLILCSNDCRHHLLNLQEQDDNGTVVGCDGSFNVDMILS